MANLKVSLLPQAKEDMIAIYDYIKHQLQAPMAAMNQFNRLATAIESLTLFPERCPVIENLLDQGIEIRRLVVDNYLILYRLKDNQVVILRVVYGASDLQGLLRDDM